MQRFPFIQKKRTYLLRIQLRVFNVPCIAMLCALWSIINLSRRQGALYECNKNIDLLGICLQNIKACTLGQSLWYTNCLVNFSFFWSTKKKFGRPKRNFGIQKRNFGIPKKNWSTNKKIGRPKKYLVYQKNIWYTKKNLVDQKNEKLTGQLVYQRD